MNNELMNAIYSTKFLKLSEDVSEYLRSLGYEAPQTGQAVNESLVLVAHALTSEIKKLRLEIDFLKGVKI